MEEKKNNSNFLSIILFVLLLIAVGVICYLLGSNSVKENDNSGNLTEEKENNESLDDDLNKEETPIIPVSYNPKCSDSQTQQKNLLVDIDEAKYNNIFEYIEDQENVQITLHYCDDDPSTVYEIEGSSYKLTESEKQVVLNEMKDSTFEISKSGIGGACISSLGITYERSDKAYKVSYFQLFAMTSDDGNVYKILDKSVNNTLEEPQHCLYNFNNLSSTATSLLNKLTAN